jgi:hypothetical protein
MPALCWLLKIGKRTLLFNDIFFDKRFFIFIKNLIHIIDLGFNFVPSFNLNQHSFFYFLIKYFDKNIEKTNAYIFFNLNTNLNSAKRQNKTLSDFENILAKLRNRSDFKNIPLLNETLELRFQYILELAHREKFILKENISELQVKAIEYFIKAYF